MVSQYNYVDKMHVETSNKDILHYKMFIHVLLLSLLFAQREFDQKNRTVTIFWSSMLVDLFSIFILHKKQISAWKIA